VYIAVTTIAAPKPALERMAEAFWKAAPDMKGFPGCVGFELWLNEDTLQAISRWESKESVEAYVKSPLFSGHHPGVSTAADTATGGAVTYYEGDVLF
jgi:heme oxygenase (staphylobilin-producing)